jgi:hypothetical protein
MSRMDDMMPDGPATGVPVLVGRVEVVVSVLVHTVTAQPHKHTNGTVLVLVPASTVVPVLELQKYQYCTGTSTAAPARQFTRRRWWIHQLPQGFGKSGKRRKVVGTLELHGTWKLRSRQ